MPSLIVIDNFDSFTFNIANAFASLGANVAVFSNNKISIEALESLKFSHLVVGPGPDSPKEAGISKKAIEFFLGKLPILGVCLGHQAIAECCGAKVLPSRAPKHGKTSPIFHHGSRLFEGVAIGFQATRYHSLIIDQATLPPEIEVTAWTSEQEVMGIAHRDHPLYGVQFHPEAYLSGDEGLKIFKNFLKTISS